MRYIGLDVHYRSSTYCVLEENGREVQCETVRGHWPQLLDRLRTVTGPWRICFEATCGYGYLYRELSGLASQVVVAHPGQLRLIFRAKRKNDRVDARKLAKLLYLDELGEAKRRVRTVTKALDEIGERHAAVLLLRTIPGVGIRTAETMCAYLDNARRFVRSSQVGAYFGLVPCQDASAGVNRLGHITRQGPATARKYLVEAAWQGVYRSATIRAYFERVLHGRPERRKIALVATAHYLLRCMYAMLIRNQPWHEAA